MRYIRLVFMTVVVLLGLGLQTVANASDIASYRIAYRSAADKNIWTINVDGTDAKQITDDGADKQGLIASPDGRYLAYYVQSWYGNEQAHLLTYRVVVVLDIATGEQRMITGQEAIDGLGWSPDSQKLLFMLLTRHDDFSTTYESYSINRDGSERFKLGEGNVADSGFSWSPDGKHILYSRQNSDSSYVIAVMDADGSNSHELTRLDSCFICSRATWTLDSQSIVFYKHPNLYIMDADGQNGRQLTDFEAVYNVIDVSYARYGTPDISFSADSQSLYYTMGFPIQAVKLDLALYGWANRTVLYEDTTHSIRGNMIAPDGKLLFFNEGSPEGSFLSSLNLETKAIQRVAINALEPVMVSGG